MDDELDVTGVLREVESCAAEDQSSKTLDFLVILGVLHVDPVAHPADHPDSPAEEDLDA